jgi:hypothetical protein
VGGNCRRADIDGKAEGTVMIAGPNGDDLVAAAGQARIDRDSNLPRALSERLLERPDDRQIAREIADAPLLGERAIDALEIGGGLVHVGLLHFDIVEAGDRVDFYGARFDALSHHLLVHLAFRRHVDDGIAEELRLAG